MVSSFLRKPQAARMEMLTLPTQTAVSIAARVSPSRPIHVQSP